VPIRKSITPDHLISLQERRQCRALKRHLTKLGLTPEQYRAKWGLPADYPMTAPNYSKRRSELAHKIGLGRKAAAEKPTKAAAKNRGTGARKRSRKG
jgi:predicted transcriptional regulator